MEQAANIIQELANNQTVFAGLLQNVPADLVLWRPHAAHWCLLEIVCHLYDEEREDFRARVKSVLDDPQRPFTSINPVAWVQERAYLDQDYEAKTLAFLTERAASISWLKSLENPQWNNTYQHPSLGPMSAGLFLANWLAHDQLHIRQINRVKRGFLQAGIEHDLSYAGNW